MLSGRTGRTGNMPGLFGGLPDERDRCLGLSRVVKNDLEPTAEDVSVGGLRVPDLWWGTAHWAEPRGRLPKWAQFMARCGHLLAAAEGRRITIGVTVPARGYSAVLAAAGATLARDALEPMAPSDLEVHLAT